MEICSSKMNPAGDASRGLDANKNTSSSIWFKGPEFFFGSVKLLGQQKEQKPSLMKILK